MKNNSFGYQTLILELVFMRVKLLVDLTKYDIHLVPGVIGRADLEKVSFTDWEAEMVECKFPDADPLPIGWNGLEILDKGYWKARERDIKQAVRIELCVGPRGGFKYMRVWSVDRSKNERIFTTDVKNQAEKMMEFAKQYNKEIIRIQYMIDKRENIIIGVFQK